MLPSSICRASLAILVIIAMVSFIPVCIGKGLPAQSMEKTAPAAYIKDSQYAVENQVIGGETGGWQGERDRYARVKPALISEPHPSFRTHRRSPTELWVYDARPEMGIGVHAVTDESAKMVRRLGIRFARTTMYWYMIENTAVPGAYDMNQLRQWDETVKIAKRNGVELVVVVHGNPPGAKWENRYDTYKRFASFVGAMAARYPQIRYWELWNEMNVAFTDLFGANKSGQQGFAGGKDYARMLKLAYPAIKKSNPKALVLNGGLAWDWRDFLRGIYESGGRDYFDIMNIHSYGIPVNWGFLNQGYICRHIMRKYGDASKPLWITEFGVDAGNIVNAWGFAHDRGESDGDYFDKTHLDEWRKCVDDARDGRLYQKYVPYAFSAVNELDVHDIRTSDYASKFLPAGMTIDDYGFGIVRRDSKTPRPTYDWLLKDQVNAAIVKQPVRVEDVTIQNDGYVPVSRKYRISGKKLIIEAVRIDSMAPIKIILKKAR